MINQYFDLWPNETGLPFHIFIGDMKLVEGNPQFLAPTEEQLAQGSFNLKDCQVVKLTTGIECISTTRDMQLQFFLNENCQQLMKYCTGEISIVELKQTLSTEYVTWL